MAEALPVVPEPPRQRLERFRRSVLPGLVWLTLAAVAAFALADRTVRTRYTGLAHSLETLASPTVTSRVEAVLVGLNDKVSPGQPVVLLDDVLVRAMVDTAQANIRKLRADLTAASASVAMDSGQLATDLLRLRMDEEQRRLEALSLQAQVSGDSVEVERRRLEAQRVATLSGEGLAAQADYENARLAYEELRTRTERTKEALAQTESLWRDARGRREAHERRLPPGGGQQMQLAPVREAIAVEEVRLREIELQREALILRSAVAGQVSQVWCGAGQSVRAGDPILTIVESRVRDIIVYVDPAVATRLASQVPVSVTTRTAPRAVADSAVVSVGESVQVLPQRLWRDPRVPTYGRAVVIAPVPQLPLSPGDIVDVTPARQ
jgi:multidrug resistance efflux pump